MRNPADLKSWHADWRGLRVVVVGLGVSGFSVADTLAELGCELLVVAEKAEPELLDILDVLGVKHLTGEAAKFAEAKPVSSEVEAFDAELVITSPGVRPDSEVIKWAAAKGLPIWVDIELAWRLRDKNAKVAEWITITGTNGKTTTTQLVEAMLLQADIRAVAVGNIGVPILDAIRDPLGYAVLVVELSSFQLHYLGEISPVASAVLNIDEDHLDWHGNFENYRDTKAKIYEQTKLACVYNVQDTQTETMVENADVVEGARAIGFTIGAPSLSQVGYVEDILCDRAFIEERQTSAQEIATLDDLAQIGVVTPHLMANVAAATALVRSLGVPAATIKAALRAFRLDAHRIEVVAEAGGVTWVDDSKATNPHATAASLASFESVIWVVGGLLKGVDISPLVKKFANRLKAAVVIGAERAAVLAALNAGAPETRVFEVDCQDPTEVMTRAVDYAAELAADGDTVLLAPAAASMDQFKDYADRGNQFQDAVRVKLGLL